MCCSQTSPPSLIASGTWVDLQKLMALFTACDAQDQSMYSWSWLSPTQKGNHVSPLPTINLLAGQVSGEKIKADNMGLEKVDTTNLGQKG